MNTVLTTLAIVLAVIIIPGAGAVVTMWLCFKALALTWRASKWLAVGSWRVLTSPFRAYRWIKARWSDAVQAAGDHKAAYQAKQAN